MQTTVSYLSIIISYLVFILLGYQLSRKIHKPLGIVKWSMLFIVTLIAIYFKPGKIDIMGFVMQANWCLQGLGIGVIAGLLIRMVRSKSAVKSMA